MCLDSFADVLVELVCVLEKYKNKISKYDYYFAVSAIQFHYKQALDGPIVGVR